ncbi:Mitosis inducer protein blt1 [Frankliniella fusca]|uniref:Mitosis inducer protein blt1 n=1 Tax=Frankliniella fusca TaxID=407009 RepID=A0AAE1HJ67_9NEOP|nr:Mitosis inducer protein blt1 [Frankliniella fusca]
MELHRLKNGDKKEGDAASQASSQQKRKKNNNRLRHSNGYLQEWVHQSRPFMTPAPQYEQQYSQIVGPYWEVAGAPRMFAAISDPTVCRYSVPTAPPPPIAYSYEPVSLPLYQPAYQPAVPPSPLGAWRSPQHMPSRGVVRPDDQKPNGRFNAPQSSKRSSKLGSLRVNNVNNPLSPRQSSAAHEEYLSLPPGIDQDCDLDDSHRRFSDPGLAHAESEPAPVNVNGNNINNNLEEGNESGDWSHNSSSSSEESENYDNVALSEQLNILKADNKRLAQELRDTRAELHKLKLQASTWGNPVQQDYQPGMIADLVREIRDAAQLREETLLSRLRLMMADGGVLRLTGSSGVEKENSTTTREPTINSQDSQYTDDSRDSERLARLERQLSSLQLQNGGESVRREEQLRRELQEAQAARKMAESNVNKLEKLMNMMRKKMNGVTVSSERDGDRDVEGQLPQPQTPPQPVAQPQGSPAPSSLESLTSACSSNHGHQASSTPGAPGPVTDL